MTTAAPGTAGAAPASGDGRLTGVPDLEPATATRRGPAWSPQLGLLVASAAGLAAGGVLHLGGAASLAHAAWGAVSAAALTWAVWLVVDAARHRRFGVDVLAVLALAGTLTVGEYLAGAVIALMLASGRSLESWAAGRAERELRALVDRAPRRVHRYRGDGTVGDVDAEGVKVGDVLLVKPGEVVPVDGHVEGAGAVLDESALTGEPLPVEHRSGEAVRSGTVNAGGPFDLRATASAAESSYAGLVRLVAAAEASSAPTVRIADRYAAVFVGLSVAGAAMAWWLSGLGRAVAVLVVATPCPLILAVPVALVAGLSRSAQRGVIVRGGAVLERLARAKVLLFDKTGTLTSGRPTVADVEAAPGFDPGEALRLAASLDQVSPHVLAEAVVRRAQLRDLPLSRPAEVEEVAGHGIRGRVDGHAVTVGNADWAGGTDRAWVRSVRRRAERVGRLCVFVAVDDRAAAALLVDDPIRPDAARTIRRLREAGIERIVMVTGDRADVADSVGALLGVDEVLAERSPADKVDAVRVARRSGPTVMVGDGINDAPALAQADVGVALGARGATASSEAADAVLNVDRLDRLADAVAVARRSLAIATQSVVAGIGMSVCAMVVAGAGALPATWGAVTQELIDVAVILNALRALRPGRGHLALGHEDAALTRRFSAEHLAVRADIERVRVAADAVGSVPSPEAVALARDVHRILVERVLPHEQAEDEVLYPMLARVLGGTERTATMSRGHVEIAHLTRRLGRLLDDLEHGEVTEEDLVELRRLLYALHAILRLHTAQEDENYLSLVDDPGPGGDVEARPDTASEQGAGAIRPSWSGPRALTGSPLPGRQSTPTTPARQRSERHPRPSRRRAP